jgi:hypothetical protein
MRQIVGAAKILFALACGTACATGTADGSLDDDAGESDDSDVPTVDDAGQDVTAPPDDDAGPRYDAALVESGPKGDGGDGGDADGAAGCAPTNTCQTAEDLGSISGDTGSQTVTSTGFASKWETIKVTEDNHALLGQKLKISVTLTSPAGANFDLFLHLSSSPTDQACGPNPQAQSVHTSGDDTASLSWGEGTISNGNDDSRNVAIEVRYVSGVCDPNSTWTLTLQGN